MNQIVNQTSITLRWVIRDRLLHAVLGVAFFLLLLVPVFSSFSMRQVQEVAITITLSTVSLTLVVLALLLGSSSIWRDIERRYTSSVLTLPITRATYQLGRFLGIAVFITVSGIILGIVAVPVIFLSAATYPSLIPIHWFTYAIAVGAIVLKGILLAAVAFAFSSLSTSFFLPFFCTMAIYLAGSASQEVYEYVNGKFGDSLNPAVTALIKITYYLIPNFSAFNFQTQAIYGLSLPGFGIFVTCAYFVVYTALVLTIAVRVFSTRELS